MLAWEQRKLGEVAAFSKGAGYTKADIAECGDPLFLYGRLYTAYETAVKAVDTFAEAKPCSVFSTGKEVVTPSSGEEAEGIAVASAILSPGIILGGGLNIILPTAKIDQVFLALSISYGAQHDDLARRAQGKSVVHLYSSDLSQSFIRYPAIEEQRAIGAFFSDLDDLITLHQRERIAAAKLTRRHHVENTVRQRP